MDSTKKFDGRAKDYTAGRPDYAAALIDCFYEKYGMRSTSVIADIGSGTGKFAKLLLERGSEVWCVEPNEDMRKTAEKELCGYPGFHSADGNAENTSLPSGTADFITTAQAFHWFDVKRFRQECSRILKKNGRVFLIWNVRDISSPINKELYDIYAKFCPDFKGFSGGIVKDDPRIKEFFGGSYEHVAFDHPLYYDEERFIARSLSGSYSLRPGDSGFEKYMEAIKDVFARYSVNGTVVIPNRSEAYTGII